MTDTDLTIEDEAALRRVGRYEILREVGRGGTAVVYLARQTDLERRVALKELAAFHAADPAFAERFLREARLAGSLNHPNIVTVHEYFEHDGTPFIAMEYFERGSLRPLVGELTLAQVAGVLEGVLAGLTLAETRGVVHRDLKPENVMVTTGGGVKITDFGIAKALQASPEGNSLTSTGSTVGTPAYMAPELALGNEIGPWTDLYGLGVMAYELLTGRVPFDPDEMPIAILLRHVQETVPPLRSLRPELDPRLSGWVERLLAKNPADRPASAAQAWEELEEALIGVLGPRWRREATLGAAAGDRLSTVAAGAQAPEHGVPARATTEQATVGLRGTGRRVRIRRPLVALAALVAAAGAVVAVALTGGREHGAAPTETPTGTSRPVADLVPGPAERVTAVVTGSSVFLADPRGRVIELDRSSLATRALSTDPAGPRSLAVRNGRVFVADGRTVGQLSPSTLAPLGAEPLAGSAMLAGGSAAPLVAVAAIGDRGRLCVAGVRGLGPCTPLAFAPSGVGVFEGRVYVASGRAGTVNVLERRAARLVPVGSPIAVGADPHGTLVVSKGRLYVPVRRGIAVVDLASRRVSRIGLPVTPAALWVVPFNGRLFAALPATGRVAVLDTARPAAPAYVSVGREPVALAGGASAAGPREVVVVDAADGRLVRLDALTGARLGSRQIARLGAPAATPLVVRDATATTSGDTVTITLRLAGSGLDPGSVTTPDAQIRDGSAAIDLWQGAIGTAFTTKTLGTASLRVLPRPGRVEVQLSAASGLFASLTATRRDRHTVVIELVQAPRPPRPGGTTPSTTTTPPTRPKPRPAPPPTTPTLVQE